MDRSKQSLGPLVAIHGIAPAYLQRAIFIVILSFIFFLAMMLVYYIRQNILYFLLSTAFLIIYLVTLFSWVMQRKNVVEVHENGLKYKKRSVMWSEVESVDADGTIYVRGDKPVVLPSTIHEAAKLTDTIRKKTAMG